MKILIVSQYFWPESFRINDLSSELVNRGHDVTVLTGKPNYPEGRVYPEFHENSSKYSRYQGADIVRVPMITRGQGSRFNLIINYLSFAFSASIWGWVKLRKLDFDVIFVFEPSPITVGIPALVLKKIKGIPVVIWVLDLWPETLETLGVVTTKTGLSLVGKLVSFIYKNCDLVLGQSKGFLDNIALYCRDTGKIKYFPSWSEDLFLNSCPQKVEDITKFSNDFKVLFAGNVGEAQDFPSIIAAAEVLKNINARVKIFVVGDGRMLSWVKQQVEEKGLQSHINLLGRHSLDSMPGFYASADALLVSLKASPAFSKTIPGKVQSYLIAGKPILGMLDGEGARIIDEANAGYTCRSGDYAELADKILIMSKLSNDEIQMLGENGKNYAYKEFDRNRLISQLEQWFKDLANIAVR